ncbi:MAG: glycosyltransferase family 2 protein [Bacteroidota bacterium]|nr:glycosyltransferase family 2 protein [Bacteroidota bacterium]
MKKISIILPVCNEQGNIIYATNAIDQVIRKLPYIYEIIYVDDGSTDGTLNVIKSLSEYNSLVKYISFSRNFGHQSALKAGLDISDSDCVISMDGDLQHPPELIPRLLQKWELGFDVVYTIRKDDSSVPYLKRRFSSFFYYLLNKISDTKLHPGAADFRLLNRNVVNVLKDMHEYNLFIRGIVKWIGFTQYAIEFTPGKRKNGESKYNMKKMLAFAINGITSFSDKPLYIAAYLGCAFSLLSVLYVPYAVGSYLFGYTISGWTSLIVTLSFFGGLQLLILGIIGIYLGKLFMQSKNRPLYITRESNIACKEKMENLSY